jgi:hypothetical protein
MSQTSRAVELALRLPSAARAASAAILPACGVSIPLDLLSHSCRALSVLIQIVADCCVADVSPAIAPSVGVKAHCSTSSAQGSQQAHD